MCRGQNWTRFALENDFETILIRMICRSIKSFLFFPSFLKITNENEESNGMGGIRVGGGCCLLFQG